mgnify:CR=1 FL=1
MGQRGGPSHLWGRDERDGGGRCSVPASDFTKQPRQNRALEHPNIKVRSSCSCQRCLCIQLDPNCANSWWSALQKRALEHPKIEILWDSVVEEAYGNAKGMLGGVKVKNLKTGGLFGWTRLFRTID